MPHLSRFKLPPRAKRVVRFKQPDGIRMAYYSELKPMLRRMQALVRERVRPMLATLVERHQSRVRTDATRDDAANPAGHRARVLLEGASRQLMKEWPNARLAEIATRMGRKTSDHQKAQLFAQVRSAVGIDIGTILDKGLASRLSMFAAQNVSLIRSVQTRYFSEVERAVLAGISEGARASDIAADIAERGDVSESNALRIANDQIGKLTGQLNEARQEALGISSFVWRTMHDNRVRPEHEDLDGESFDWNDPPDEGIPGEPINCRCYAEPDLQDLLDAE